MPPKFTADMLEDKYGPELGRPPLSDAKTARMLRKALLERNPPLDISDGIFFFWDNTQYLFFGITHSMAYMRIAAPQSIQRMQCIRWIRAEPQSTV